MHLFGHSHKRVRVIDYSVLSELGKVNHVIFDKTDTLVKKTAKVTALAAGGNHSLTLLEDGEVYAWGSNTSGQLGPANE